MTNFILFPPPLHPCISGGYSILGNVPFAPKREYLTGRDNIFIPYERPGFLSNVGSVYQLSAKLDRETLVHQIENFGFAVGSRYLKKVNRNEWLFGRPFWEDAEYDVRNHLLFRELPEHENNLAALKSVAEEMFSTPLDWRYPLWHVTVVEGYVDEIDGHVSIGDGMGLTGALLTYVAKLDPVTGMADVKKDAGDISKLQFKGGRRKQSLAEVSTQKVKDWSTRAMETAGELYERILGVITYLFSIILLLVWYARTEKKGLIGSTPDQRRGSLRKQVGWSKPVPFQEVVRIKNVLGVTINDVLVACFNSALRNYLEKRHRNKDPYFTWLIPKSMRAAHDFAISNETSGFVLSVPSNDPDSVRRRSKLMFKYSSMTTDCFTNLAPTEIFAPGMADEIMADFLCEITTLAKACDALSGQLVGEVVSKVGVKIAREKLEEISANSQNVEVRMKKEE
ncbi:hypothetical protein HDU93_008194 [Gonapodya sp. JEL0774]|nr:hypothetical protein HDU93_008194 [Gonapodya sp. JEL0774]